MINWISIWRLCSDEMVRLLPYKGYSWNEFEYSTATVEAREQDLALGEQPLLNKISSAIDTWTIDGQWMEMSDATKHCIRIRLHAVADFVYLLTDCDDVPFLKVQDEYSDRDIVRWFLTEWWSHHGLKFFAQILSARHYSENEDEEL